jgi:hypothetical protein
MFECSDHPLVRPHPDGDRFILAEPFWFRWESKDGTRVIERTLEPGFVTDGLSVPKFYRARFSPFGRAFRAAIAHDALYRECPPEPRGDCDQVFLEGMRFCGESLWNRNVMHKMVRAFGWARHGRDCK